MSAWLIARYNEPGDVPLPLYFGGKGRNEYVFTAKVDKAVKFNNEEEAEHHALLIAIEYPELLGKLLTVERRIA